MLRTALTLISILPVTTIAQTTRTTHGDTTYLSTKGNGVWGPPRVAVEVARIGGGPSKETTLSQPTAVTALPDGGVIFFDAKALDGPIIRWFDENGKFLRNLGRIGSGPGEYRTALDIKVSADGRIWIADVANARVNIYSREGKYLSQIRIPGGSWSIDMLRPGGRGEFYLEIVRRSSPVPGIPAMSWSFLRIDSTGRVLDTLQAPRPLGAPAAESAGRPVVLSDGQLVLPAVDRVGYTQQKSMGNRAVIVSTLDLPRVRYTAEERRRRDSLTTLRGRSDAARGLKVVGVPRHLSVYKQPVVNALVDLEDRVWLQRATPSEMVSAAEVERGGSPFRSPVVFDAFRSDGTFLGEITIPNARTGQGIAFVGNFAWMVIAGDDEEVYLVKYRLR